MPLGSKVRISDASLSENVFIFGYAAGNFGQLFDLDGWDFHRNLAKTYGAVCKVHGLFGVRLSFSPLRT